MKYQEAQGILRNLISEATAQKSDVYYEYKVQGLAQDAADIFHKDKNRTQMKNLVNVSLNVQALADVFSYIKSQASKDTSTGALWREKDFAKNLIGALEQNVAKDAENLSKGIWDALKKIKPKQSDLEKSESKEIINALGDGGYNQADLKRTLRLQLVRLFVQHLEAHYIYSARVPS